MAEKKPGDDVNVEVDMVGKYVEKSVQGYFEGLQNGGDIKILQKMVERMVDESLRAGKK
jgi:riboflavin synthase